MAAGLPSSLGVQPRPASIEPNKRLRAYIPVANSDALGMWRERELLFLRVDLVHSDCAARS